MRHFIFLLALLLPTGAYSQIVDSASGSPIRVDAVMRGVAKEIPVGELLIEAVGQDAWVLFADDRDASIRVTFEGPSWATDTVKDALAQAGLRGVWIGTTLVVYGDRKPYIVGHTPRSVRRAGETAYIVPAGTVIDVFSQISGEWRKLPMIDDPVQELKQRFMFALKFEGKSLSEDLDEFRYLVSELSNGEFNVGTNFLAETSILHLEQDTQPKPLMPERVDCYRSYHVEKNHHVIREDMKKCRDAGVWVIKE